MARMVGLSRPRFYQLVDKGTFPVADRDPLSNRPCYLEEKQRQILEARHRNRGVDGKPVLFYSPRKDAGKKKSTRPVKQPKTNKFTDLVDGLAELNVTTTVAQIKPLVTELFPLGIDGVDIGDVIRAVFLKIKRQNSPGKQ